MYGYIRCMGILSACEYSQAKLPEQSLSAQKFITLDSNVSVPNEGKSIFNKPQNSKHKAFYFRQTFSRKPSSLKPSTSGLVQCSSSFPRA